MFFHKMLDDVMARVNDIPQEYFEEQNRLKILEVEKRKQLEKAREERVSSMDYTKELERTDLTHKQRMFYSKMAEWQKNE